MLIHALTASIIISLSETSPSNVPQEKKKKRALIIAIINLIGFDVPVVRVPTKYIDDLRQTNDYPKKNPFNLHGE